MEFKNEFEMPLEPWVWILVQFGVETNANENVWAISSFCLNWGILENWGKKYV